MLRNNGPRNSSAYTGTEGQQQQQQQPSLSSTGFSPRDSALSNNNNNNNNNTQNNNNLDGVGVLSNVSRKSSGLISPSSQNNNNNNQNTNQNPQTATTGKSASLLAVDGAQKKKNTDTASKSSRERKTSARKMLRRSKKPIPIHREATTNPIEKFRKYGRFPMKLILNIVITALLSAMVFAVIAPRLIDVEHQRRSLYHVLMPSTFIDGSAGVYYVNVPTAVIQTSTALRNFLETVTANYYSLPETSPAKYRPFVDPVQQRQNNLSSYLSLEEEKRIQEQLRVISGQRKTHQEFDIEIQEDVQEENGGTQQQQQEKREVVEEKEEIFQVDRARQQRQRQQPSKLRSSRKRRTVYARGSTAETGFTFARPPSLFDRSIQQPQHFHPHLHENKNGMLRQSIEIVNLDQGKMNNNNNIHPLLKSVVSAEKADLVASPMSPDEFQREPATMRVVLLSSNGRVTAQPRSENLHYGIPMTPDAPWGIFTRLTDPAVQGLPRHNSSWLSACAVRRAVESAVFGDATTQMFFPCRSGFGAIENNVFDMIRDMQVDFKLHSVEYGDPLSGGQAAFEWAVHLDFDFSINGLCQITMRTAATSIREARFSSWTGVALAILLLSLWDVALRLRAARRILLLEAHLQQHHGFLQRQGKHRHSKKGGSQSKLLKSPTSVGNQGKEDGKDKNDVQVAAADNNNSSNNRHPEQSPSAATENYSMATKPTMSENSNTTNAAKSNASNIDAMNEISNDNKKKSSPLLDGKTNGQVTNASFARKKKHDSSSSSSSSSSSDDSSYDELGNKKKRTLRWKNELRRNFGMGWIYLGVTSDVMNVVFGILFLLDSFEVETSDQLRYWHSIVIGISVLLSYSLLTSYLRYFPKLYMFLYASDIATPFLARFLVICLPVIVGSSMFGYIVFGSYAQEFFNPAQAATALIAAAFGDSLDQMFQEVGNSDHWGYKLVGRIYAFVFISFYYFVINNLAAAIAVNAYGFVLEKFAVHKDKDARAVLMKKSMAEQLDIATAKATASMKHLSLVLRKYENEQALHMEINRAHDPTHLHMAEGHGPYGDHHDDDDDTSTAMSESVTGDDDSQSQFLLGKRKTDEYHSHNNNNSNSVTAGAGGGDDTRGSGALRSSHHRKRRHHQHRQHHGKNKRSNKRAEGENQDDDAANAGATATGAATRKSRRCRHRANKMRRSTSSSSSSSSSSDSDSSSSSSRGSSTATTSTTDSNVPSHSHTDATGRFVSVDNQFIL